jgi:hypothetical protein
MSIRAGGIDARAPRRSVGHRSSASPGQETTAGGFAWRCATSRRRSSTARSVAGLRARVDYQLFTNPVGISREARRRMTPRESLPFALTANRSSSPMSRALLDSAALMMFSFFDYFRPQPIWDGAWRSLSIGVPKLPRLGTTTRCSMRV